MNAAFHVFATRGYHASRLEEVAEEAGLTKGAIYYHFDGKEDLLRQAVQRRQVEISMKVYQELQTFHALASVKIRRILRRLWQHLMEPAWGHAFRLIIGEVRLEFPALFRMWLEEGPVQAWSAVRDLVQVGVDLGEFRPDADPEVSARIIVSGLMLQAALQVHSRVADLAPCDADRIIDSGMDLLFRGLAAPWPVEGTNDGR